MGFILADSRIDSASCAKSCPKGAHERTVRNSKIRVWRGLMNFMEVYWAARIGGRLERFQGSTAIQKNYHFPREKAVTLQGLKPFGNALSIASACDKQSKKEKVKKNRGRGLGDGIGVEERKRGSSGEQIRLSHSMLIMQCTRSIYTPAFKRKPVSR